MAKLTNPSKRDDKDSEYVGPNWDDGRSQEEAGQYTFPPVEIIWTEVSLGPGDETVPTGIPKK
ncbi:MAG: hypothetical protein HY395_02215 [Candidatus Doudnabacteria bacterium]|nr:hypothetical protein [Candidatus Doudnabacteria bacterium]